MRQECCGFKAEAAHCQGWKEAKGRRLWLQDKRLKGKAITEGEAGKAVATRRRLLSKAERQGWKLRLHGRGLQGCCYAQRKGGKQDWQARLVRQRRGKTTRKNESCA